VTTTEDAPTPEATGSEPAYKWVGTRPIRHDGLDKVTGRALFSADMTMPGVLHGFVLRSPHAHANITLIDTAGAAAMPGVKAIITGADFPDLAQSDGDTPVDLELVYRSQNIMARDKVLYQGHAIAAVAATSLKLAKLAAEAIDITYEVLPHCLTLDEAMAGDAPLLHNDLVTVGAKVEPDGPSNVAKHVGFERGDINKGFAEADLVVEREFTTKPVHQGYIEPHAVVAHTDEERRATLWCSSQGHFAIRDQTAAVLGWDRSRLKVTPAEIGGGFGGKTTIYVEPLAVKLSEKANRPVKIVMTRDDVFRGTGPASGSRIRVKIGATNEGKFTAAHAWLAYEAGAFPGASVGAASMTVFAPYRLENFLIEGLDVVVNKPKTAAYRAPGAPMAAFAVESVVDEIAVKLGLDPFDIRLTNAVEEGIEATYGPKFPRVGMIETIEAVRDHPNMSIPLGPNQGRGVATGYWFNFGGSSTATVNIVEDGTAAVITGSPDIGGSRASMALMAAEELGIDVQRIRPSVADTEAIGYNDVTGGSRVTFATGMAVIDACRDLIGQLRGRAATMWGCDLDHVEWVDGSAQHNTGKEPPLPLLELAAAANRTGGPLTATASLTARGAGPAFSTQVCDVEVDPDTGQVTVLRYTTAQDAGRAIHPSYVEGQMQGGVAQGIGWALNEEYIHNSDGAIENPSFLDYRMPVASDLPMIDTVIVEVPNPSHPYGVRGVGEVGIVPPLAAVANAVSAATGHRFTDLPLSPVAILHAIS